MGMHEYEVGLIEISLDFMKMEFENCVMAEMGNQRIRYLKNYWDRVPWPGITMGDGKLIKGSSKYYHTSLGVKHDSFDINGIDGAEKVDLTKPIDKKYMGNYNVVTNFGNSEHCGERDDQYVVFDNMDKFCCRGGLMIHNVPHTGNWPGHGNVWYTTDFFEALAKIYDYDIITLEIQKRRGPLNQEDFKKAPKDSNGNLLIDGTLQNMVTCVLGKKKDNVSVSKGDFSICESYLMDS